MPPAGEPTQPARLLLATPDFPPRHGGIQILMQRLQQHLEGFDTRVVTRGSGDGTDVVRPRWGDAPRRVGLVQMNLLTATRGWRWRPDVVLAGHITAGVGAAFLRRRLGVGTVLYLHADEISAQPALARLSIANADRVIAVSEHTAQLGRECGASDEQLRVVAPGVDVPAAIPDVPRHPEEIVTVARLTNRYKGHDVMLEAVRRLRERRPGVRWTVIGDGPLRGELEERAAELGVADAVEFAGSVADAERDARLAGAAVFAMPSRLPPGRGGEGFGIVYLEAGALGVPVLAGRVAGALDAVRDGETGVLVDPADPVAVADGLEAILGDPGRAAAMGRAGRRWAEEHAWPRVAGRVGGVLHEAMAAGAQDRRADHAATARR